MALRFGFLTPSSNTVVEKICARIAQDIPDCSMHFARFEVLHIDNDDATNAQFQDARMLDGFELLSHTRPDVIAWSGTAAAWLGVERDRSLVQTAEERTGCSVITATLSILDALERLGIRRIGLVTPYKIDMQNGIISTLSQEGLDCVAERHFDMTDNFSFGVVQDATIAEAARQVAREGAEAVVILCTNLAGAEVAATIEEETGVPVLDSVVMTVWGCLRATGKDPSVLAPWGPKIASLT